MTYTGLNIMQIILYQSILRAMFRVFWSENQVKHAKQFEAITMASKMRRHGNPLVTSPSEVVLSPPSHLLFFSSVVCYWHASKYSEK